VAYELSIDTNFDDLKWPWMTLNDRNAPIFGARSVKL